MLERTEPMRTWTGAFRAPPNGAESASGSPPESPAARGASVFDAVNDAYRVIDEYLWQGQQAAQKLWTPLAGDAGAGAGAGLSVERLMRSTGDLARLWLELLQRWSAPGEAPLERRDAPAPGGFRAGDGPVATGGRARGDTLEARELGLSVSVESERPVLVHVELHGGAPTGDLCAGALGARDPGAPALDDISIERAESGGQLLVRLRVPHTHPRGVYNGLLLDRETGLARGTISVSLT